MSLDKTTNGWWRGEIVGGWVDDCAREVLRAEMERLWREIASHPNKPDVMLVGRWWFNWARGRPNRFAYSRRPRRGVKAQRWALPRNNNED